VRGRGTPGSDARYCKMNAGSESPCVDTKTPSPLLPASSNQPWNILQHHFTNPSLLVDCMEKLDHELSCLRRELQLRCHCSAHAGRAPCNKSRVLHCLHQSTQDVRDVFCASSRRIRESINPFARCGGKCSTCPRAKPSTVCRRRGRGFRAAQAGQIGSRLSQVGVSNSYSFHLKFITP
jgi:hypothetical protein